MIDPTKIRPLHDYVLIRRDAFDDKTAGGLFVPDIAKTAAEGTRQQLKRGRGVVLAVGPGRRVTRIEHEGRGIDLEGNPKRKEPVTPVRSESHSARREPMTVQPGDVVSFDILADLGDLDEYGHPDLTLVREGRIACILEPADTKET